MSKPKVLFHWTHVDNLPSIGTIGLDPSKATGPLPIVWAVTPGRVDWSADHISDRHQWAQNLLVLLRIDATANEWNRTAWTGVFTCPTIILPQHIMMISSRSVAMPVADFASLLEID